MRQYHRHMRQNFYISTYIHYTDIQIHNKQIPIMRNYRKNLISN
jgi:hypothetical protein